MDSFEKDLKVLILTNHMENIAGSEIVALEVAESFQKYGCNVKIYANQIGLPMADIVRDSGIELDDSDQYPNPFDFDIIWSQHHVIPLLISTNIESKNDRPYFIFAHLSPYEPLETVGLYTEHIFADKILVNSHETKERLESLGVETDKIEIFYNASPSSFQSASKVNLLKNILLISNHPPQELLEAIKILEKKNNIRVSHIGTRGRYERLQPSHIAENDAVITIGKSVQYAINGARAVYCYDHFGGPGWITLENFKKSENTNFSGRCCHRKISAEEIANEVVLNFEKANQDVFEIREILTDKYLIDRYIKSIFLARKQSKKHVIKLNKKDKYMIMVEAEFAKNTRKLYCECRNLCRKYNDMEKLYYQEKNKRNKRISRRIKRKIRELKNFLCSYFK